MFSSFWLWFVLYLMGIFACISFCGFEDGGTEGRQQAFEKDFWKLAGLFALWPALLCLGVVAETVRGIVAILKNGGMLLYRAGARCRVWIENKVTNTLHGVYWLGELFR